MSMEFKKTGVVRVDGDVLGENLISNFDTSFLTYNDGAVTILTNQMNGGTQEIVSNINGASKCLHLHSLGGNSRQYGTLPFTSGKTYTISADYYSPTSQSTSWRGELNGGDYSWTSKAATYTTPGKWQRLSYTYTSLTSDATMYFFAYCKNGSDCYIKNIKIEEGSIPTAWTPNPADELYTSNTQGAIETNQNNTRFFNGHIEAEEFIEW